MGIAEVEPGVARDHWYGGEVRSFCALGAVLVLAVPTTLFMARSWRTSPRGAGWYYAVVGASGVGYAWLAAKQVAAVPLVLLWGLSAGAVVTALLRLWSLGEGTDSQ